MSRSLHALQVRDVGVANKAGVPAGKLKHEVAKDADNIIGRHMNDSSSNLTQATAKFNQASDAIFAASDKLHANMDSLSKRAKESVSRAKDTAAQMTDAMNKITKLVGSDFEIRLKQLQDLTDCLERLSALQEAGKLEPLMRAIGR